MKIILLLTVAATLLCAATNRSSVGGPLTEFVIVVLAMWAVGVHGAWSKRWGPLGWIASIALSLAGGAVGLAIGGMAMEATLSLVHFQGSLAKSNHPLLYILSAAMAVIAVLGSWSAAQVVGLVKRSQPHSA